MAFLLKLIKLDFLLNIVKNILIFQINIQNNLIFYDNLINNSL